MAPQTISDIQIIRTGTARHPDMAEIVHAWRIPKAVDDNTVRAETMETCSGLGRVYGVNHILKIDGFFRLAIRPDT